MSKAVDNILLKLLIDEKLVGKKTLTDILKDNKTSGASLIASLVSSGVSSESAILKSLSKKFNLQFRSRMPAIKY